MRKYLIGATAAAVLTIIAGCSSDTGSTHHNTTTTVGTSAVQTNNAADVTFAQGMIPHHAQAVEMAKLVPSRSTNQQVLDIARRVQAAQDPEIKQLNEMLTRWGVPAAPGGDHSGHGADSGGMMTAEQMTRLEKATGAEFDRMWTEMMIRHHEGAIVMARTELATGTSAEAKALAQKIIDAQQAEITELRGMLG